MHSVSATNTIRLKFGTDWSALVDDFRTFHGLEVRTKSLMRINEKVNGHEVYIGFLDFFTASSLPFCVRAIFPPSFFPLPYLTCA